MIYDYLELIDAFKKDIEGTETHTPTNFAALAKHYVNRAKDKVEIDLQSQWEETMVDLVSVASQQDYDLPVNIAWGGLNRVLVETGVGTEEYIEYSLRSQKDFDAEEESYVYAISSKGDQISLYPIPTIASLDIRIHYNIETPDLVTGTVAAATASTIQLESGTTPAVLAIDDIYNTVYIRISSGTGVGQERMISDFVGSTLTATVSEDWDTTPDTTSVYSTIPSMPPQARQAIVPLAVAMYRRKQKMHQDAQYSKQDYVEDLNRAKKTNLRGRRQPRFLKFTKRAA